MPVITARVGRGGGNVRSDVMIVQELLNAALPAGNRPLKVDGLIGPKTIAAIAEFQRLNIQAMSFAPTSLIAPGDQTWKKLVAGPSAARFAGPVAAAAPVSAAGPLPAKFTFDEFWDFTEPLEGGIAANFMFMVQDLQVATGMGITFTNKANRAAGLAQAKALSWVTDAGAPCSGPEITRDYDVVLSMESTGRLGPGHLDVWRKATTCRLTLDGLKAAVRRKITDNLNQVIANPGTFGIFSTYPADAQLCIASLSWAIGINFHLKYPKFCGFCKVADWYAAGRECGFTNKENTLPKRQRQQELMMSNAGACAAGFGNPEKLHFPATVATPGPSIPNPGEERDWNPLQISIDSHTY